jgi:poly-gamma-glutamate capsule biosynthesis protein CapA/YwtB (metallophosphatase superfamily)
MTIDRVATVSPERSKHYASSRAANGLLAPATDKPAFTLAAMGDVMLSRSRAIGQHLHERPQDFRMQEVADVLAGFDLVFANLESPVGITGTPHPIQHPNVTFRCHPEVLAVLKNLGVTVVSLGNNHMLDYGAECLAETLEHLDASGIRHVGAGRNYEEANRPLLLRVNGKKVAFLAYVFLYSASTQIATRSRAGVSDHRIGSILPRIRELTRAGYQVIVSAHWGLEYSFYPLPYQMEQARRMIREGASLVIGHGPHYPQGIETCEGGRIVYSLGNFLFDEPTPYSNRSFIYGAAVASDNAVLAERLYPFHINDHVPTLVQGRDKERLENLVRKLSESYATKDQRFWQRQNSLYFRDIVYRVQRMKSFKFVLLPPLAFYGAVGTRNYARKLMPRRLKRLFR